LKLFDHRPARFEFAGPPDEGARRLATIVYRSIYRCYITGGLVGRVTGNSVRIGRHRPGLRNSFAPVLYAEFKDAPGGAALVGHFQFPVFLRLFLPVWFGVFSCFLVLIAWRLLRSTTAPVDLLPAVGSLLFAGVVAFGLLRLTAPWAEEDVTFIEEQIGRALKGDA
jgi:hypothetical protein